MQRLSSVATPPSDPAVGRLLDRVQEAFGSVPNTTRVMANSPAVLDGFLALSQALSGVGIGERLHNQIKLAVSEANACKYCTSILSAVAPSAGLTPDDILAARHAGAQDAPGDAALKFAKAVLDERGNVSDKQLQAVRGAGFDDGAIVEIVASVVLGCFTNFLNQVADTDLDTPAAPSLKELEHATCATGTCSTA